MHWISPDGWLSLLLAVGHETSQWIPTPRWLAIFTPGLGWNVTGGCGYQEPWLHLLAGEVQHVDPCYWNDDIDHFLQVKERLLRIPKLAVHQKGVLWESTAFTKNVFISWNSETIDVLVYHAERLSGSDITYLCSVPVATGQIPLLLQGPELICLTASSKLMTVVIPELAAGSSSKLSSMTHDEQLKAMQLTLTLGK